MNTASKKESYSRLVVKYKNLNRKIGRLDEQANLILSKLQTMIDGAKTQSIKNKILRG